MASKALLEATAKMVDMLENPTERIIGESIFLMLSEFSNENWQDLKDSGATEEWLRQYLPTEK